MDNEGKNENNRKKPQSNSSKKKWENPGTSKSSDGCFMDHAEMTYDGIETCDDYDPIQCHSEIGEYSFEVLSAEEIFDCMVDGIADVSRVTGMPDTATRILLNHFKWDIVKLYERFFDGNNEQLLTEAKLVEPVNKNSIDSKPLIANGSSFEECEICFTSTPSTMMTGLNCGHRFCTQCWDDYLKTKIMEEGIVIRILCPAHACTVLVGDVTVMNLVGDSRVIQKYQHLIINNFVECNRFFRWCPYPDCNYAIKVSQVEPRPVTCKCHHTFCFGCGENWHDPVKCYLLKRWIKKCEDDSETSNWLASNTKLCPKCGAVIEKDGGCNHMICKNQGCKADFCWVCLGPWEPHGSSWYSCNRFKEEDALTARQAQDRSRAALQRYLFYCNRYLNHMRSLMLEKPLYASVKQKMEDMQHHNMSWIEVQFLEKAVDVLCQCRQTLMYTYVFAYYLNKNNQSAIFEDNQNDLERATEIISEYLERDITLENQKDIQQKVQDKYKYCENRRKALLEHVYEGYENDWWEYSDS